MALPTPPEPTLCANDHPPIAFHGELSENQCPLCLQVAMVNKAAEHIEALCREIDILAAALVQCGVVVQKLPNPLPKNLRFINQHKKKAK